MSNSDLINRNIELALLYLLHEHLQTTSTKKISLFKVVQKYFSSNVNESFTTNLEIMVRDIFRSTIIDNGIINKTYSEIKEEAKKLGTHWTSKGIKSIVYSDFKHFPLLSNVKEATWLFYRGNINITKMEITNFVSVVGSRKTPTRYNEWIERVVPANKIIVSGLAGGADLLGHQYAMKNNTEIVIFPVLVLLHPQINPVKRIVYEYGIKKGVVFSEIFPGTKIASKFDFLKRNKWMAQIINETYLFYFEGISGSLGQAIEAAIQNQKIYVPKYVWIKNASFIHWHKYFNEISKFVEIQ